MGWGARCKEMVGMEEGEAEVHRVDGPTNERWVKVSWGKKNDKFYDIFGETWCVWRIKRLWGNESETDQLIWTRTQELYMSRQGVWILS